MDAAVAAALVAGGWTALATLGTQWLAGRRESARDNTQSEREERARRWDTNRERLIELRDLLDKAAIALMATEKAIEDLRVAVTIQMDLGIAVPAEQHEPVTPAHGQLDEFQGRLALRLGTTHGVTRSFTLARASVSEANLALTAAASESSPDGEAAEASREERAREYLEAADAAQRDIRTHRIEFFDRARQLVGVEDAPRDAAEQAALAKGATAAARDAA